MPLTFTLVEATHYRIRYLATDGGGGELLGQGVIQAVGAGDADIALQAASTRPPLDGFLELACANQTQARHMLCGHDANGVPNIANVYRAHIELTPVFTIGFAPAYNRWTADANEGAAAGEPGSAGFAVVEVSGPNLAGAQCYVDINLNHTRYQ